MNARYLIGDVFTRMAELEDGSIDCVITSPPFLALRSYLPADHPDKGKEIGSEPTPAAFLDTMLALTAEWGRLLAPHGSIAVELGDTYAGSGGAGGDYNATGKRGGQQEWSQRTVSERTTAPDTQSTEGSAAVAAVGPLTSTSAATATRGRPDQRKGYGGAADRLEMAAPGTRSRLAAGDGWPLDKSLALIPQLYAVALSYGINPLTGEASPAGRWRVRNVVRWCRPNPPVGALGDKFRPATSEMVIATRSRTRYFDLDAVREPLKIPEAAADKGGRHYYGSAEKGAGNQTKSGDGGTPRVIGSNPAGAPPLDWWEIPTHPYKGAHYAAWPPDLLVRPIKSMVPERVCRVCGEPSRRIVETLEPRSVDAGDSGKDRTQGRSEGGAFVKSHKVTPAVTSCVGWSDCGHDAYRPGVVLDPFAGSGTTLMVATGHGRDAIGIDLDSRNADLARDRVGMFLEVEDRPSEGAA